MDAKQASAAAPSEHEQEANVVQPDRSSLFSPAITERNHNMYSQRRGHIGGQYALQSLRSMIAASAIGHYTVEQVISKADPCDYRQELIRLGYVLKLNEESKDESPRKTANRLSSQLGALTLEELIAKIQKMGSAALESQQTMGNLNN